MKTDSTVAANTANSGTGARFFDSGYERLLIFLFSSVVVLSITDMLTTSIALGKGLEEGNAMILALTAALRLNLMETLVMSKAIFILGAAVLALLGSRSDIGKTRKLVKVSMIAFVAVLLFVSMNNLTLIVF